MESSWELGKPLAPAVVTLAGIVNMLHAKTLAVTNRYSGRKVASFRVPTGVVGPMGHRYNRELVFIQNP